MSTLNFILIIVILALVLFVFVYISTKVRKFKNEVMSVSSDVFGTTNIIEGLKQVEEENNNTPLSISGGDSIYYPMIQKDFKDFDKTKASNVIEKFLMEYFQIINGKSISEDFRQNLSQLVIELIEKETSGIKLSKIHKIAISNYNKSSEYATITYQAAVECLDSADRKSQHKYEVYYTYSFTESDDDAYSLRCPYCGAPVEGTATVCGYCGTVISRNLDKVWKISKYKKAI